MAESDGKKRVPGPFAGIWEVANPERESDIFKGRQGREQVKRLEHEADGSQSEIRAPIVIQLIQCLAEQSDAAPARGFETGE